MLIYIELQDGIYAVRDGILYKLDLPAYSFPNAKTIELPKINIKEMQKEAE